MKRGFIIFGVCSVLSACSIFQKTTEAEPLEDSPAAMIMSAYQAQRPQYRTLRMTGRGTFTGADQQQSFRYEVRLVKDSLIWVSLKDPFLGITLARGVLTADSLMYYNSLDRSYYKGSTAQLKEILPFPLGFSQLSPALTGGLLLEELPFSDADQGLYRLFDHDPSGANPPPPQKEQFYEASFSTGHRLLEQGWRIPTQGKSFYLRYSNYQEVGPAFPLKMNFQYQGTEDLKLDMNIGKLETGGNYPLPFRIPTGYERIP